MKQNTLKIAGLALAAALAITARADVAIHQNVSMYGYAAGSIQYSKPNTGNSDTKMDLDAAKLGFAFNFAPVTAKVSVYSNGDEIDLLEANATYDLTKGWSITGGRYQSWIGYEAFDIPNGNFITYGHSAFTAGSTFQLPIIPNFHEGVKVEYAFDKSTIGLSVVDSIFNGSDSLSGDGKLSDGYGIEAHYGFNDGAFSLGATLAYQNSRAGQFPGWKDAYIGDVWAQYIVKNTTFGGEFYYMRVEEDNADAAVFYGLVMIKQQMSEKFSLAGRFSAGEDDEPNAHFWKISAQPSYAVTEHLSLGAEVSYTKYNNNFQSEFGTSKSNFFAGVQACFKF